MRWRVVLIAVSAGALLMAGCGDDDDGDSTVAITVEVAGLTGAEGNDLVGVLFQGPSTNAPDGMGGFNVEIDTDPFSTSQVIRQPDPDALRAGR